MHVLEKISLTYMVWFCT